MTSATRLKVVHLVTLLELGGAQGNTIHTVRSLDPNRFDAHLWCGRGGYWDSDVEADLGKQGRLAFIANLVRPVRPLSDVLAVIELYRRLRSERPDILHTHSSKAGILGRIAARLAGVPIVVHTFHGFGFNDRQSFLVRRLYVALERWTARFSSRLVFVSDSNWKEAERRKIGDPARYTLIRSGVPLQRLAQIKLSADRIGVRADLRLPADARIVVTISAFKPQKNLTDFLELADRVAQERNDAYFVLIGDGELRPLLERQIGELKLNARTRLPGWVKEPARILAAADVFVLTSLWEGLPRALVESMALGVPAVCYRADGVADLLSQEDEIRPRGDLDGLAASVLRLLRDPDAARKMAASQGSRITRDYDIVEMVRQQEMLYLDLRRRREQPAAVNG